MTNDDTNLRNRFRVFAAEDAAAAPDISEAQFDGAPRGRRASFHPQRLTLALGSLAVAGVAMTIGILWGANTGYASARVAGERQRSEMTAATTEVTSQLAALRIGLRRLRADVTRRSSGHDASLLFVETELRSMEASAERIERDLADGPKSAAAGVPPLQVIGFPVNRALAITCSALRQPVPAVQQGIPIIDLAAAKAVTSEAFGAILGVRQTSDGGVLVNDALRRQLKLFDTTLTKSTVVMDSVPGSAMSYGAQPMPLLPYLGDSSLFGERPTATMRVLDERGRVVRSLALPKRADFLAVTNAFSGIDANGNLIYRGLRRGGIAYAPLDREDSLMILRADLDFRRVDTIGRIARPLMKLTTQPTDRGAVATLFAPDPLQPVDDWAVLSNGTVALIRGHDYHIDWIQPTGPAAATPKLPFDWKRLTDEDKHRLTDSVRNGQDALLASGYQAAEDGVIRPCSALEGPLRGGGGGAARTGAGGVAIVPPPDAEPGRNCSRRFRTNPGLSGVGIPIGLLPPLPPLADLVRGGPVADYLPPIGINSTLADRDGNLWILPRMSALSKNGELVYDVVSSEGKLFQRVRLPAGRSIAGFGKGGVVYLQFGDRTTGFRLERTRLASPK